MKSLFRVLGLFFAGVAASLPALHAATPQYLIATKITGYSQTTAGGDFTSFDSFISTSMTFATSVSGTTAVLNGPGVSRNLTADSTTSLGVTVLYSSGLALESAFPAGSYSVVLGGASSGTYTFTFPIASPAPVRITNYTALQSISGSSATVQWEALPISTNETASVLLQVYTDDDDQVFITELTAASRSVVVTGLPTNKSLHGYLSYISLPTTTVSGLPAFVARGTAVHFTLTTRTAPVISTHPLSQAINGRSSVPLSVGLVEATGATYQWNKDGASIAGATSSTYNAPGPGFYTVTVTNAGGATTSNAAVLNATAPLGDSKLFALSCRARVGTGGDVLIPGVIIGGTGSRQVIVRAKGPSIIGVSGTLARPRLQLYNAITGVRVAENIGWDTGGATNTAALRTAFTQAGLETFADGSADCALLATVSAGSAYTAIVGGVDSTTGVGLVEVYEVGAGSARMTALSCRAQVGTGGDILIPGIIISGSSPKQLIVRAKGPGIEGVAGVLAQPTLSVYSGAGVKLAQNTGWSTSPDVAAISAATAAAGLIPFTNGSGDCAIVLTLPPGGYTAQVSGLNDTTGVALIEVYEVP